MKKSHIEMQLLLRILRFCNPQRKHIYKNSGALRFISGLINVINSSFAGFIGSLCSFPHPCTYALPGNMFPCFGYLSTLETRILFHFYRDQRPVRGQRLKTFPHP